MSRRSATNIQKSGTSAVSSTPKAGKRPLNASTIVEEEVIQTSFRLPRSRWKRLQVLAIDERASVQSIIIAALEREFSKRGLKF